MKSALSQPSGEWLKERTRRATFSLMNRPRHEGTQRLEMWRSWQNSVNKRLTIIRLPVWPGHLATMAGFWPHNGAQRCRLLRIGEQRSARSTGV